MATYCWCAANSWPICSLSLARKLSEGMQSRIIPLGTGPLGSPNGRCYAAGRNAEPRRHRALQAQVLQVGQALQEVPRRLEEAVAAGLRGALWQAELRARGRSAQARAEGRAPLTGAILS